MWVVQSVTLQTLWSRQFKIQTREQARFRIFNISSYRGINEIGLRKDIKEIKDSIKQINSNLDKTIIEKAKKFDELSENLKKVELKIKSAKMHISDSGEEQLKIEYEINPIYLQFDPDNNIVYNPEFYAINMLNLISPQDMQKMSLAIERAKIKKK